MAIPKLTDVELQMRIIPTSARWPSPQTHRTIAWGALRDARDRLRTFVRTLDDHYSVVEQDRDLSPDGIARRRAEYGRSALAELENWPPLIAAEKAVSKNVAGLEAKMTALPPQPQNAREMTLALALAQHLKMQKMPASVRALV